MTAGLVRRARGACATVAWGAWGMVRPRRLRGAGRRSRVALQPGSFVPDIKPEVYLAPWRSAVDYLAAWRESPFLGSASFDVGLAPVAFVVAGLDALGAVRSRHVLFAWRFWSLGLSEPGSSSDP